MFERVYLINLKTRTDRLAAFRELQKTNGWHLPEPIVFEAFHGNTIGVPNYYVSGGGAWGCLRSHSAILEREIMNGSCPALMLEDDVFWHASVWPKLEAFLERVPDDWDVLFLGGQHMRTPHKVCEGVGRVFNTQRTHSYAIRGPAMKSLLGLWQTCNVHIDHRMGPWAKDWKAYCPDEFLFFQAAGRSDISGRVDTIRSWNDPKDREVIFLETSPQVANKLRNYGLHMGYERDRDGYDRGLTKAISQNHHLRKFIDTINWEAASLENTYACVYHPKLTFDQVCKVYTPCIHVKGATVEECLEQLKDLQLRKNLVDSHVLLLHCQTRQTVEDLTGFHRGYWLCRFTGYDLGCREAFEDCKDRNARLCQWLKEIKPECEKIMQVPLMWHEKATLEIMKEAFPNRTIIEVTAETTDEINQKWREAIRQP